MTKRIGIMHKTMYRLARTPAAGWIKRILRAKYNHSVVARKKMAESLPDDPIINNLAVQFAKDGYCKIDGIIDKILLNQVANASDRKYLVAERAAASQESHKKDFWTRLLDEDKVDGMLTTDNPFVAFALQKNVLSLLAKIYGEIPFLDDVLLVLSRSTGKKLTLSQLWHYDYDDTRTIKLYIYLTDVNTTEDGPFTFLSAPVSKRVGSSIRSRRLDDEINAKVKSEEIVQMFSPRLSVFMVETSRCLHMGSRVAEGHERLMYMASFITVPRMYPEPEARFRVTGTASDLIRCVLTPA